MRVDWLHWAIARFAHEEARMTTRNLQHLFAPVSVAVIGASLRPSKIGTVLLNNLLAGGFRGKVYPVNPKYDTLAGLPCHHNVGRLPQTPELALICTPPRTVPGLIAELGERGTKAAIVFSAGLDDEVDKRGINLRQAMLDAARPHLLRILGPDSIGLLAPAIGLNASYAQTDALPGKLGFVSQSQGLATGILDWAKARGIGFSRFIVPGDCADVDVGDILDYLAADNDTQAILLCIEQIGSARKFMSAARAAARVKPVLVLKSGRTPAAADESFDAAIRRAGMLRVATTEELFDAVETLARALPRSGDRLAILTNGGGPGALAADALLAAGGQLAALSLPTTWPRGNPLDLGAAAGAEPYANATTALLAASEVDAVLVIHAPTVLASADAIADAVATQAAHSPRNLLTCWLGGKSAEAARNRFAAAGMPTYDTPEEAVRGFMQIVQYQRNQKLLMQVPAKAHREFVPDRALAQAAVDAALAGGRAWLDEAEAAAILTAYGMALVVEAHHADTDDLSAGMMIDAVFGPVIVFGRGDDRAVGLPPLNMVLAQDMIARTRAGRRLQQDAHDPANLNRIARALVDISHLIADIPQIVELAIDPARPDAHGVVVRALHIRVAATDVAGIDRFAIRPYPDELEEWINWQGQPLLLRPIKPEDGAAHVTMFNALAPEDIRYRFFSRMRGLQPAQLARLTQIDYDREMAFIATCRDEQGVDATLGVVRVFAGPDKQQAEFAVSVRSDLKGKGLGPILMHKLIAYCRSIGVRQLNGETLPDNLAMQNLARRCGFTIDNNAGGGAVYMRMSL